MDSQQLQQQIATKRQSFFDEGILDQQQFMLLEDLEREENFDFVEDVSTLYLRDTNKLLTVIEEEMEKTSFDHDNVEGPLYKLKGSSASIGAVKVKNAVTQAQKLFNEGNLEGFKASIQAVKSEREILKTKLETYFQLVNQLRQFDP